MKLIGDGGFAQATLKGATILFLASLAIYVCKMFFDSDAWDKLILSVFVFSAIFQIACIFGEEKRRQP